MFLAHGTELLECQIPMGLELGPKMEAGFVKNTPSLISKKFEIFEQNFLNKSNFWNFWTKIHSEWGQSALPPISNLVLWHHHKIKYDWLHSVIRKPIHNKDHYFLPSRWLGFMASWNRAKVRDRGNKKLRMHVAGVLPPPPLPPHIGELSSCLGSQAGCQIWGGKYK